MAQAETRSERWSVLLALLAERRRLDVDEVAAELGVSAATVRRDFAALADEQLVTRVHGGVVATSVAYQLPARYRQAGRPGVGPGVKERIAAAVAELLPRSGIVGLNGGTTCTAVARELGRRETPGELTLVTNALNIAAEMVLRPQLRCLCLGGMARPESYEVTGALAISVMEQLWLNVAVLGVNGLSAAGGATCRHEDEAGISALMARRADRVVVAAEGGKVGRTAFARICAPAAIHALVTDDSADERELEHFAAAGTQIVRVAADREVADAGS